MQTRGMLLTKWKSSASAKIVWGCSLNFRQVTSDDSCDALSGEIGLHVKITKEQRHAFYRHCRCEAVGRLINWEMTKIRWKFFSMYSRGFTLLRSNYENIEERNEDIGHRTRVNIKGRGISYLTRKNLHVNALFSLFMFTLSTSFTFDPSRE